MTNQVSNETHIEDAKNLAIDLIVTYKNKYGFFISTFTRAHVVGEWVHDELTERFLDPNRVRYRIVDEYNYDEDKIFNKEDWNYALITLSDHLKDIINDPRNKDNVDITMNKWKQKILDYSYDKTLNFLLDQVKKCYSDYDCDITCDDQVERFFRDVSCYANKSLKSIMLH